MEKKKLNFRIYSYNNWHNSGEPAMIMYEEIMEFDYDKSFYVIIKNLVNQYIIKSQGNLLDIHYFLSNINELLWNEYFEEDSEIYPKTERFDKYLYLDLPIGKLDCQFHICNKTIILEICPGGRGAAVGTYEGTRLFFHTNEKDIHHIPHIHCRNGSEEFRVDLKSLKPLDKTFKSRKKTKHVLEIIQRNQDNLLNYWNQVVVKGETLKYEIEY